MAETTGTKKKSGWVGTAVRTITPAIPLALALTHAAITGGHRGTAVNPVAKGANGVLTGLPSLEGCRTAKPCPLMGDNTAVNWFFVFKFNSAEFPGCQGKDKCPFGGSPQTYPLGQHYAYASSDAPNLQDGGSVCLGATKDDPVSASFNEIYNGNFHYVIWNDQPYGDPAIADCSASGGNCDAPWAHSKGVLAWNDTGEGFVMQVSTPSWPISGSFKNPLRESGNSLGCFKTDNNVTFSQHFFALALNADDVETVLTGLANAGVATDKNAGSMMVSNGGPVGIQSLVASLGTEPSKTEKKVVKATLSSGVEFLSKSSGMDVPPWQFVSAELGGPNLRVATYYDLPHVVASTQQAGKPGCWDPSLGTPGAVDNAKTGSWIDPATGKSVPLNFSSSSSNGNHAKIGVTTSGSPMAVFGDENQQGTLEPVAGKCISAQNGRGGTFYALPDAQLAADLSKMLAGASF